MSSGPKDSSRSPYVSGIQPGRDDIFPPWDHLVRLWCAKETGHPQDPEQAL